MEGAPAQRQARADQGGRGGVLLAEARPIAGQVTPHPGAAPDRLQVLHAPVTITLALTRTLTPTLTLALTLTLTLTLPLTPDPTPTPNTRYYALSFPSITMSSFLTVTSLIILTLTLTLYP